MSEVTTGVPAGRADSGESEGSTESGAKVAAIDIGTVTARLGVAEMRDGALGPLDKTSTICNLGEGLSQSGRISDAARERVTDCVRGYVAKARKAGAAYAVCTLTAAARDASNSDELVGELESLGLKPQVIPGEVEGRLTFLGVSQDFPGRRILVADNGGGSTELALGSLVDGRLEVEAVRSEPVGARLLTEKFLSRQDPPSADDVAEARTYAGEQFSRAVAEEGIDHHRPDRLVVTGGTATTLVAVDAELDPYDPSYVHLSQLSRETVEGLVRRFGSLTEEERTHVVGLQAKRAPVILGGTVALAELMARTGFDAMTVSESDLLVGLCLTAAQAASGVPTTAGWVPELAPLE